LSATQTASRLIANQAAVCKSVSQSVSQ